MSISIAHAVMLAQPRTMSVGMRAASPLSIQRRILLAFLCVSLITASLGTYAIRGMVALGDLTDQAIDGALLSIGYARSASAGFGALEAAVVRYKMFPNRAELLPRINDLSATLDENLAAVAQHAFTPQAEQAAASARAAVADWRAAGGLTAAGAADGSRIDALARIVNRRLGRLIDHAAGDGLQFQERARAKVTEAKFLTLLLTFGATILGGLIASQLARRIVELIASVSAAACRIAAGHAGADGLGAPHLMPGRAHTDRHKQEVELTHDGA